MGAYPIGIVGESFRNDDGSSRQVEIKRCSVGEVVRLERDPANKYDENCVKVVSMRGIQIGNISREDSWICERLDREAFIDARILRIGESAGGHSGVVICVRTAEDDEWLVDEDTGSPGPSGCSAAAALIVLMPPAIALFGVAPS